MKTHLLLGAAAMVLSLAAASAATAGFTGDTVSANYEWPNLGTILYPSGTAVVGPGVEFDNIGGFGVGNSPSVDFSDTNILVDYTGGWTLSGSGTYDGWVFTDLTSANITGVSLASTTLPGFVAADLSFDANDVYANTLGLGSWGPGTTISIDVTFGSGTPEPATWAMMLLGFGGLGAVLRRRRAFAVA